MHPLREFATLTSGVLLIILVTVLLLGLLAEQLARFIPFEFENVLADQYTIEAPADEPVRIYLQQMANNLAKTQQLPADMRITVHYVNEGTVNAFATLGGHIIMFRGLLQKMPHENALAMVLAHEIAHIKFRHPIRSFGRGAIISMAIAAVSGSTGESLVEEMLGQAGLLTMLRFSRDQESQADEAALAAVVQVYGHAAGADALFHILKELPGSRLEPPQFLSSHPLSGNRIQFLADLARSRGWPEKGEVRQVPLKIQEILSRDESEAEARQ